MKDKRCFISYAHSDRDIVYKNIVPVLKELGIDYWFDENEVMPGGNIFELILKGIKRADFVLTYFNSRSSYVNLEMGAAIGLNKPLIIILNDKHRYPFSIRNFHYIYYNENNIQKFRCNLERAIQFAQENVIDKLDIALNSNRELIGIQVGTISRNYIEELRVTADLINFLEELSEAHFRVEQTSEGSLKSLLSIDFESLMKLVEKIIFIIPEFKKRKAKRLKIEAEARKIDAETEDQKTKTRIKQANAFLDIIERSQKIGLKLQLGDELLMLSSDDILRIKEPEIQNENNYH